MIRKLCAADAPAVRQLCETALGHHTDEALIAKRMHQLAGDAAYYIAVYEADGKVLGFIQAQRYDLLYGGLGWNIIALAVAPQARRQGVGSQLVQALEAHARQQGCDFVRLNSRVEREDAHQFYEHLGYRCDKLQKRFIKSLDVLGLMATIDRKSVVDKP